jgi:RimJ/RimL family protein N-acetyltransferase
MVLRAATRADHPAIREAIGSWWGGRDLTPLLGSLFLENFASTSIVSEDAEGRMDGFLVGFPSVDDPTSAYVHFIGVAPGSRGEGLGRTLHATFADQMRERGVIAVRCVTTPVNEASVAFHESIGFVVEVRDESLVHFVRAMPPAPTVGRADPRPGEGPWPEALWPVPESIVLARGDIELRLATAADSRELFDVLDDDAVWAHVRGRPATAEAMAASMEAARGAGRWPWIVRQTGRVVGTTSFLEVSSVDARIEIGFTLYSRAVWGSDVNPTCKLLLMGWAFEQAHFGRVQLKTDIRNGRSQAAIARLGARFEGILRRYQRRQDGSVRDTVLFSVTAEEWPSLKAGLDQRLSSWRS